MTCDFCPIVFPGYVGHDELMHKLGLKKDDICSAGFVSIDSKGRIHCSGRSDSLGKESHPEEDERVITRILKDDLL